MAELEQYANGRVQDSEQNGDASAMYHQAPVNKDPPEVPSDNLDKKVLSNKQEGKQTVYLHLYAVNHRPLETDQEH